MPTLKQIRNDLNESWQNLVDGWKQLFERTEGALTKFIPVSRKGQNDNSLTSRGPGWALIAADVFDEKDKIIVNLEIPGMEPEDFDIQVREDVLIVRGEKKMQREESKGQYYITECAYGRFERVIPLPGAVDDTKTQATYKKGLLRIELPKTENQNRQTIKVVASK